MTAVVAPIATAILRRPDVERLTQLSKATIYRLVKSGRVSDSDQARRASGRVAGQ